MDETRVFKTYNGLLEPVDGSLARDYVRGGPYEDWLGNGYAAPPADAPLRRPRQWVREQAEEESRVGARTAVRRGQSVSPLSILGFLAAAVLLVFVLMAQVRMTALSDTAAACETRIAELKQEQQKLLARYETAFSLPEVEDYAVNRLGMQKPRPDQIVYLSGLSPADRAVIVQQEQENVLAESASGVLDALWSYFG